MSAAPERDRRLVEAGGGLRLNVECGGEGPPLLLLHGFTGSTISWAPLAPALDGFATVAVDLPGHGRSSTPADPARYALPRLADDLVRVLDALHVERTAVFGYSMGGRAALQFALAHQDRVAALVLESASPGIADDAERAARVASDLALADEIERGGVASFVDHWERLPLWASQASLRASVRGRLRAQRLTNVASGLANSLRGAGAGVELPVLDRLGQQRAPALLVAGEQDTRYVAHAEAMAAAMPDARVVIVPGVGHAVHLERPDVLVDVVRHFLHGVTPWPAWAGTLP